MTDQIVVNQSAKPDLYGQALRYGIVAVSVAAASWAFHDAVVSGAVLAFATSVAALLPGAGAYIWGRWTALKSHRNQTAMAAQLPDHIATIVAPK